MFEEILDFCKLYPLARAVRAVNKAFCLEYLWKQDYEKEEQNGFAIMQREKRLTDERAAILKTKLHGCWGDDELWHAKYSQELYSVDEALLQTRNLYQAHKQKMHQLLLSKTSHAYYRDVLMARKVQYAFILGHDKPYSWRKTRDACARSRGCCGRECGCCEKPLKDYYILSGYLSKERTKIELYGHCTAECGCCIKYTGGYTPHPLFKDSEDSREK
ncbi:hypothetical protein BGW36DRAFT_365452 [Talaromyces proteolyticus]|uniref:Uncharacterized protein n=1 Tax=Talaromyces proteolyticus TaxID=1131652 RepID=A0AAD4PU49_9EURO|nr:uncharacterized protein BGW36DRAFT_365452 [Talaromyces proteolyticus]KAH8689686.1 hypothetical protein BGW36DRAFT_365452 [Talaromyces proteolyticus]